MKNIHTHQDSSSIKFCENRLIFNEESIEVINEHIQALDNAEMPDTIENPLNELDKMKYENKEVKKDTIEALERNRNKANEEQIIKLNSLIERLKTVDEVGKNEKETDNQTNKPDESKPLLTEIGDSVKSFAKSSGNFIESATDAVLPEKYTKHMSRNAKIAVGILGTGGAIIVGKWLYEGGKAIVNRIRGSAEAGKEAAKKNGGSKLKQILIGTGIGLAAFFGISYALKVGGIKGMMDRVRNSLTPKEKEEPWKKYGLTENEYYSATNHFKERSIEIATSETKKIFNLKNNDTSPEYELFIKDMEKIYKIRNIEGIDYVNIDASKEKCASVLRNVLSHINGWIEINPATTITMSVIAFRLGVLQKAISITGSVFAKCLAVGRALARFGLRNPLVSLLLVGGSVGTAYAAESKIKGAIGPSNMTEMFKAISEGKPLFRDAESEKPINIMPENVSSKLSEQAGIALENTQLFLGNIAEETADILNEFWDKLPENIILTEFEMIKERNSDGFDCLWKELEREDRIVQTEEYFEKLSAVKITLMSFETEFFKERTNDSFSVTENSIKEFENFQNAMNAFNMEIKIKDGIVMWKSIEHEKEGNDEDEKYKHLCIDPNIKDLGEAIDATSKLDFSENWYENVFIGALTEFRTEQTHTNSNAMMVLGALVYVWFPSNAGEYFTCHIDAIQKGCEEGLFSREFAQSLGAAAATSALVSFSTEPVTQVKRLFVGGRRPMPVKFLNNQPGKVARLAVNLVPGVHPVKKIVNIGLGIQDISEFTRMYRIARPAAKTGREAWGYAKQAINACSNEGIRATQVRKLLTGNHVQRVIAFEFMDWFDRDSHKYARDALKKAKSTGNYSEFNEIAKKAIEKKLGTFAGGEEEVKRIYDLIMGNIPKKPHTTSGAEIKAWRTVLAKFNGVTQKEVCQLLREARDAHGIKVSPRTLLLIEQSNSAKGILTGAVKSGDALEVARAVNLAKKAAMLRTIGNMTGGALDIFGLAMAYIDWQENNKNIELAKKTNNAALRHLYEQSKVLIATEGTASAVGLAIGTTAIIGTASGYGALAGIATTGGLVMLPIGVAVAIGGIGYRGFKSAAETWQYEKDDWAIRKTNGELFAELETQKPGGGRFWQRAATVDDRLWNVFTKSPQEYADWRSEMSRLEQANGGTRFHITGAIVEKMTPKPQQQNEEPDEMYHMRILEWQQNIADQMLFLANKTKGNFDTANAYIFASARTHAELMAYSRTLRENDAIQTIEIKNAKGKEIFNLADYSELTGKEHAEWASTIREAYRKELQPGGITEQLNTLQQQTTESPARTHIMHKIIQTNLLHDLEPFIARLDGKIEKYNYPGLFDGHEKDMVRVVLANMLRKELRKSSDKLIQIDQITVEEYEKTLQNMQLFLEDPISHAGIGKKFIDESIRKFRSSSIGDYKFEEEGPALGLLFVAKYGKELGNEWWYRESTIENTLAESKENSKILTDISWIATNLYIPEIPNTSTENMQLNIQTKEENSTNAINKAA